jgi:tRNA 2-thiouridine synthesizing protein A
MQHDKELDTSGMACPLPIVKTRKALADMASGQVLRVLGTDPGTPEDLATFAEQMGHELLSTTEDGGTFTFLIRKG